MLAKNDTRMAIYTRRYEFYLGMGSEKERLISINQSRWRPSCHIPWSTGREYPKITVCTYGYRHLEFFRLILIVQFWCSSLLMIFGAAMAVGARMCSHFPPLLAISLTSKQLLQAGSPIVAHHDELRCWQA